MHLQNYKIFLRYFSFLCKTYFSTPPSIPYYIYYPAQMVGEYMFLPYLWYVKCRVCAIVGMQESAYLCNVNNKRTQHYL